MAPPARLDDAPGSHWNTLLEPAGQYSFNIWDRNVDSIAYYESYAGKYYTLDPVTPTHSVSVTGGAGHNCVLLANGQVGCWGYNAHGELGNGVTTSSSTPVATAGLIQGISLGAGNSHSCAVQYGGGVVCWGQNDQNQLGNGVSQYSAVPITVSGLVGNAATVGVGAFHSCAALVDGTVQCWGSNSAGQLGDGTQGNTRAAPVTVAGLPNDAATGGAIQVVGGAAHSCALLGDGTVRCWGLNDRGQLGNGASSNSTSPVIASGLTGVTSLSARGNATCAVLNNGTVWCWGDPTPYGVLGNSAVAPNYQRTPVQVTGITTARNVAVGAEHACASLQNNTATCWGRNDQGQLGNGTTNSSLSPVSVSGLTTVWAVGVGNSSSCALVDNHQTKCWGAGTNGELGNGANTASSTPVTVAPVPAWTACTGLSAAASPASTTATVGDSVTLTSVATGCATAEYEVYRRNADQTWTRLSSAYSPANSTFLWNTTGVTGGWQHLRVVARAPGSTQAFQAEFLLDYFLQSPDACNSLTVTSSPASTVGSVGSLVTFTNTSTGCLGTPEYSIRHRRPDGTWHDDAPYAAANSTWIWDTSFDVAGWNQFEIIVRSQNSTRTQEEVRYVDYYLQPGAPRLGGGFWQFCQLQGTGSVACWGLNSHGELGAGSSAFHSAIPLAVPGVSYGVSLGVGYAHACTSVLGGGVQCWGQNQWGQLGNGSQTDSNVAVNVAGITTALHVAAGTAHSCAALLDGTVKCWGLNTTGQLGNGAPNAFSAPVTVANLTGAKRVSAGYYHSCALLADGSVRCWGKNDQGQLGNGTTVDSLTPVAVSGLTNVTQIATAGYENCAVKADHTVWCWGANSPNGTLGDGTTTAHSAPVQVAGITNAVQVAVTGYHACAVLQDGTAKCWGRNDHGELGNGTTSSSLAPVAVTGLTGASTIAVSENASCAGLNAGGVSCWGWGLEGNLGNGSYGDSNTPVSVRPIAGGSSGGSAGTGGTGGTGGDAGSGGSAGSSGSSGGSSGGCTPNCATKHCGDDLADGCGNFCAPACGQGAVGCHVDSDCVSGTVCQGRAPGSTAPNICVQPECANDPRGVGCGYEGAPCGPYCTVNPVCVTNADCPSGYVCGQGNGDRYGIPGINVCERPGCSTDPATIGCGAFTAECGLCSCTPDCSNKHCGDTVPNNNCGGRCTATCADHDPAGCELDSDCQPGSVCALGQGSRVGLPAGSNVCMPARCFAASPAPSDCGSVTAPCGVCPGEDTASCVGRECGLDPQTGAQCGSMCGTGQFCNDTGHCAPSIVTQSLTVPKPDGTFRTVVAPPGVAAVDGIGAIAAQFAVTDRGAATYSIPLEAPPGRAGIEPNLSLQYSSTSANGVLGMGWSLGGLSAISRCPKTVSIDGAVRQVALNASDALCLDGQRLVSVGTNEFATEVDSFSKIIVTANSTGWDHFTIYSKDGRVLTYGGTADAKGLSINGVVRVWALNRVEDRKGNFLRIHYSSRTNADWVGVALPPAGTNSVTELLPDSISYTGNGTTDGSRSVRFTYSSSRTDKILGFLPKGDALARTRRLDEVLFSVGATPVRKYVIGYQPAPNGGTTRLTSLRECAGAGTPCKGATTFNYYDEIGFQSSSIHNLPHYAGDFSSEFGIPEFIPLGTPLGTAQGYDQLSILSQTGSFGLNRPIPGVIELASSVAFFSSPYVAAALHAFNVMMETTDTRIGYRHLLFDYPSSTYKEKGCEGDPGRDSPRQAVIHSSTYGDDHLFCDASTRLPDWFIDLDGDGVQDHVWCGGIEGFSYKFARGALDGLPPKDRTSPDGVIRLPAEQLNPCYSDSSTILTFDFDGDGTGNIVSWQSHSYGNGGSWYALVIDDAPHWVKLISQGERFLPWQYTTFVLDVNGDGLKDVAALPRQSVRYPDGIYLWLNDGVKFRLVKLRPDGDSGVAPENPAYVVDYDHDGIEEIFQPNDNRVDIDAFYATCGLTPPDNPTCKNALLNSNLDLVWEVCHFGSQDTSCVRDLIKKDREVAHAWSVRRIQNGTIRTETVASGMPVFPGVMGDFDGDGDVDVITRGPKNRSYYFYKGTGKRHNLLSQVTDGQGRVVRVHYDSDTPLGGKTYGPGLWEPCQWPTSCLPKLTYAPVSSVENAHVTDKGLGSTGSDRNTAYSYEAARVDSANGKWLGFRKRVVEERDGSGRLLKTTTLQMPQPTAIAVPFWPPVYVRVTDGLVSDVTEYYPSVISGLANASRAESRRVDRTHLQWQTQFSAKSRPFPVLLSKTTSTSEEGIDWGVLVSDRTETSQFDPFGNRTDLIVTERDHTTDRGFDEIEQGSTSTLHVHRTFDPTAADQQAWLVGLVQTETIDDQPRCPENVATCTDLAKSRHSEFFYWPGTTLLKQHVRERGDFTAGRTTDFVYDPFGNLKSVEKTATTGEKRSSVISYDDESVFPVTVTNRLGHVTQVRYDGRFGKVSFSADPNGIDRAFGYDALGFLRRTRTPSGSVSIDYELADTHLGTQFSTAMLVPAAYRVYESELGGETRVSEYDALGRVVQKATSGLNGAEVTEEYVYDRGGRLILATRPHLPGNNTQGFVEWVYDELDRPTEVKYPDSNNVLYAYSPSSTLSDAYYNQKPYTATSLARVTDANQHSHLIWSDRSGRQVRVTNAKNQHTDYRYGAFGALIWSTGPDGYRLVHEVDAYGRVTSSWDPAVGGWNSTQYNGLDEAVLLIDAAERQTELVYDDIGRLKGDPSTTPGRHARANRAA